MKKTTLILLATIISVFAVSAKNIYSRNVSDLPATAQNTLSQNFKSKVSVIKISKSMTGVTEYEVILTDGTEISFDRQGNWKDIEVAKNKQVPNSVVPKRILDYIKTNNKNKKIIGIEKTRKNYEVELENGVDIIFDRAGHFIRYDR